MKFLLCFALYCAAAIAKPTDEALKSDESSPLRIIKNETAISNNHRVERNDQLSPLVQMSAESEQKNLKIGSNFDLNSPDENPRTSYSSTNNQDNPSVYPSQLTSIQNTDSSLPTRSVVENSRSIISTSPRVSYGLQSRSYGLQSGSYGLQSGSYGLQSGSCGLQSGPYGSYESPGIASYSYPSAFHGLGLGSYGYSGSNGLSQAYGMSQSYGSSGPLESYNSLPLSVIPAPYSNSVPYHGGINIAQQIIHKPVITELQEVIHKPIITEVQEIVSKPVISEFQQVIHKPLYTEHIGLGPSYHGYQKHIVKQPYYQIPNKQFVHQPMSHSGTIHLTDKYEQAVNTHSICESGSGSSYGFSGASFPAAYHSGIGVIQPNGPYESAISVSQPASYGPVYSSNINTPFSAHYSPVVQSSVPCGYDSISSAQTSYKSAIPASLDSESSSVIGYPTLPNGNSLRQPIVSNTVNGGSYRRVEENAPPKAAEQITYDELLPYKQQSNANQQYNDNQFQQQLSGFQQQGGRSSEDTKPFKMDVDAIAKQIEKNPEMRKQLIKIISESIYVGDQMSQVNKKQKEQTIQSLPLNKYD